MSKGGLLLSRQLPRINVDLPARLRFGWNGSEEVAASIVNMSECGFCVRCHSPLRNGLEVEVILLNASDPPKTYRVAWVRETALPPKAFSIGMALKAAESSGVAPLPE